MIKDSNNTANAQGNQDSKSRRGNKDGNNPNANKDKASGQRITKTTEISSNTNTNQQGQGSRRGNAKNSNNSNSQNQGKPGQRGGKPNEAPNQPGRGGRGNNPNQNKDQQNPNQRLRGQPNQSNRDKSNQNNKNPQPNERGRGNKPNNQNQKSTPNLRAKSVTQNSNDKPSNRNQKDNKKNRPLSSVPQSPDSNMPRNNTVRILIDQTGRIPKKEYVLNVRKTDVIRRKNKIRMVYNNDPNKKSVTTEFNHNIKVIKNVTKDLPTVDSLPAGAKIIHRYNYSFNPNIPNTSRHEINETGKIPVKQVQVSPRKNNVIKTERKPLKMTYEMYNSTHQGGTKVIPLPNNLKGKKGIEQVKKENNK